MTLLSRGSLLQTLPAPVDTRAFEGLLRVERQAHTHTWYALTWIQGEVGVGTAQQGPGLAPGHCFAPAGRPGTAGAALTAKAVPELLTGLPTSRVFLHPSCCSRVLSLALLILGARQFFVVGGCPVHCRVFSSTPSLCPLDVRGRPAIPSCQVEQSEMSPDMARYFLGFYVPQAEMRC